MRDEAAGMGYLLKRHRERAGLTQRELAAASGMSVGALRDLEQGRTRSPRWGIVEELAAVLGLGQTQRTELARVWRIRDAGRAARRPRRPANRAAGLGLEVLGPLSAWRDGMPVMLGSARQRAVLGLLALHAGTGLHRDAIIDALWGEQPPASAVAEVQGYVSRLRKIAGPGAAELITTVGGCRYHLEPGGAALQLDLTVFWQLSGEARAAVRPDPARACDWYEQALGLWRGDLLADVDLLRDHPAAVEVAHQRAEAVLGYAEAAVTAGRPGRALPHLRRLCAAEALNEEAHAWLMTVLAATGQQAAALAVFADLRERLDTELGITPSPVLARAQAQVLVLGQRAGPS